jgi:hypothetical protein
VIADAVYLTVAGLGFYRAAARSIISRGLRSGLIRLVRRNRPGREIDAPARRRRIDQQDLKNAGPFGGGRALPKCKVKPICRACPDLPEPRSFVN